MKLEGFSAKQVIHWINGKIAGQKKNRLWAASGGARGAAHIGPRNWAGLEEGPKKGARLLGWRLLGRD